MASERLVTATEAARVLGHPMRAKTFMRRAVEALTHGDTRIQRIGNMYCAPMEFWQTVRLRQVGRKRMGTYGE